LKGRVLFAGCFGKVSAPNSEGDVQTSLALKWQEASKSNAWTLLPTSDGDASDEAYELAKQLQLREDFKVDSQKLLELASSCPSAGKRYCRYIDDGAEGSCSVDGHCSPAWKWSEDDEGAGSLDCQVRDATDCRDTSNCVLRGECTWKRDDEGCVVGKTSDCARTAECREDSICLWDRNHQICVEGGKHRPAKSGGCKAFMFCACRLWTELPVDEDTERTSTSLLTHCQKARAAVRKGIETNQCLPKLLALQRWVQREQDGVLSDIQVPSACR
jgi:hypothetical protein